MEEWEGKIQLSHQQRSMINNLQQQVHKSWIPIPEKVSFDFNSFNFSSPFLLKFQNAYDDLSNELLLSEQEMPGDSQKNPNDVPMPQNDLYNPSSIDNTKQFLQWFSAIQREMEEEQEESYRNYMDKLSFYADHCQSMLKSVEKIRELLDSMMEKYSLVEEKSQSLQYACEKMLEDQVRLVNIADLLLEKLEYFNDLEKVSRLFNSSGQVCNDDMFVPFLCRLDDCMDFVRNHKDYKDSELYLMRFRQLMTRGLSLIKLHFVNTMNELQTELQTTTSKPSSREGSQEAIQEQKIEPAKLDLKFLASARSLRDLVKEIEIRCEDHEEYLDLLEDCHNSYFYTRQVYYLSPLIQKKIKSFLADDTVGDEPADFVNLAQDGCTHLVEICRDEYRMFFKFFGIGWSSLCKYLRDLSSPLTQSLRPLIIKQQDTDVLARVCGIIQGLSSADSSLSTGNSIDEELDLIAEVLSQLLHEVQSRLVFRAQIFVKEKIESHLLESSMEESEELVEFYKAFKSPKLSLSELSRENPFFLGHRPNLSTAVHNSISILRKLYLNVNTAVFQDFSHECVSQCMTVVSEQSKWLSSNGQHTSVPNMASRMPNQLDGLIYLVVNLIYLRNQLAPFETGFVHTEKLLDFSGVHESFARMVAGAMPTKSLLSYGAGFFGGNGNETDASKSSNNSLGTGLLTSPKSDGETSEKQSIGNMILNALTSPKSAPLMVEHTVDARQSLDQALSRECDALILQLTRLAVEPLQSFLLKAQSFKHHRKSPKNQLKQQNFATPQQVQAIYQEFLECLGGAEAVSVSSEAPEDKSPGPRYQQYTSSRFHRALIKLHWAFSALEENVENSEPSNAPFETEKILLKPIFNSIKTSHEKFVELCKSDYDISGVDGDVGPPVSSSDEHQVASCLKFQWLSKKDLDCRLLALTGISAESL